MYDLARFGYTVAFVTLIPHWLASPDVHLDVYCGLVILLLVLFYKELHHCVTHQYRVHINQWQQTQHAIDRSVPWRLITIITSFKYRTERSPPTVALFVTRARSDFD